MARKDNLTKLEQGETARRSLLGFALLCALLSASAAAAQTQPSTSKTKGQEDQQPPQGLLYSVKGPDLFRDRCAACHGADAKGDGPTAPVLKTKVPDLTILAKNNGGEFPAARVRKIILGDESLAAHGSREMPVFGSIFHRIEPDEGKYLKYDLAKMRVDNLVAYLQSIKSK